MHAAVGDFAGRQPNPRGLDWWLDAARAPAPLLPAAQARLLATSSRAACLGRDRRRPPALPSGRSTADLFRDNVLFDGASIGGVIDFYFAGLDTFVFDLAVTCNDWCIDDATGALDDVRDRRAGARLPGAPPALRRRTRGLAARDAGGRAALWLSRLDDWHRPRPAEQLTPTDPAAFERILSARRAGVCRRCPAPREPPHQVTRAPARLGWALVTEGSRCCAGTRSRCSASPCCSSSA